MKKDIIMYDNNYSFSSRSCGIIIYDNKILLQKRAEDEYWALPGGKVKIGESSLETIYRELFEELEIDYINNAKLVDLNEYFFSANDCIYHQYIFTYLVTLSDYSKLDNIVNNDFNKENLIFEWFDLENINWNIIKPDYLKEQLSNRKVHKLNRIIREV